MTLTLTIYNNGMIANDYNYYIINIKIFINIYENNMEETINKRQFEESNFETSDGVSLYYKKWAA